MKTALFFLLPIVALLGMMPSALADQNSYDFTVRMLSIGVPFTISVQTANGYTDSQYDGQQPFLTNVSLTFNIPQNQGNSIKVCVHWDIMLLGAMEPVNCQSWTVNQHSGSYSVYFPCGLSMWY